MASFSGDLLRPDLSYLFNLLHRKCLEVRNICQFLHYGGRLRASMIFRSMKTRGSFIGTSGPADRTSIPA